MVAALALGERENEYGACEYGAREYGAREYGTRECGACEEGACEYDCESYSQNTFKTGHFALATERAPSIWIIDSGASHHMYNGPRSRFLTYFRVSHTIDIRLGDDTIVQATHKGLVQVQNHWVKALHCNVAGSRWAPDSGQDKDSSGRTACSGAYKTRSAAGGRRAAAGGKTGTAAAGGALQGGQDKDSSGRTACSRVDKTRSAARGRRAAGGTRQGRQQVDKTGTPAGERHGQRAGQGKRVVRKY